MATLTNHLLKTAKLSAEVMRGVYRTMLLSRRLDDKEIQLKRQNRIYFQINGVGHEAINVAVALCLKAGYDWFFPYYRDRALCLQLGMSPTDMLLAAVGSKDDPMSAGRQMPSHWSSKALNIVSQSSPTGTQILHAVGAAEATQYYSRVHEAAELARSFHADEVVYVSLRRRRVERRRILGSRSTGPATRSCQCSTWWRTTATLSRCPWTCKRRAEAFPRW